MVEGEVNGEHSEQSVILHWRWLSFGVCLNNRKRQVEEEDEEEEALTATSKEEKNYFFNS